MNDELIIHFNNIVGASSVFPGNDSIGIYNCVTLKEY